MKRLYLLRHATTNSSSTSGDHARTLTEFGIQQSQSIGQAMKDKNYAPDIIYCSDAIRTKQTRDNVIKIFGTDVKTVDMYELYTGDTDAYLNTIRSASNKTGNIMLIAHNPIIHMVANQIAADTTDTIRSQLMQTYMPSTLSVFDIKAENWADLKLYENPLIDLIVS